MEKRFQVYVSGALQALPEERREVLNAVLELDCIATGMGISPPGGEARWGLVERAIDDCDYHLFLLPEREGQDGPDGVRCAEMEYRRALAAEKPSIAFVRRDSGAAPVLPPGPWAPPAALREAVSGRLAVEWSSPKELGLLVSRSLLQLIKSTYATGWVRAEQAATRETTLEILRLRRRIDDLERELAVARTCPPKGSERLAQGEERHILRYTFEAHARSQATLSLWNGSFQASWNEIFAAVATLLVRDAGESGLRAAMDSLVETRNLKFLRKKRKLHDSRLGSFSLNLDDFHTVIIQLRALGLISPAASVGFPAEEGPRWTLTPFGENVMARLRAIPSSAGVKRGGFEASENSGAGNGIPRDAARSDRLNDVRFEPRIVDDGVLDGKSA